MKMTNQEYNDYVMRKAPKSKLFPNMLRAFISGGLICCVGQALLNTYTHLGMETADARGLASITLVFLGALLTALKVYDNLARFAGAGTLVPITGFANAVAAPALEFKSEGIVTGLAAKMFVIAGPVIVFGTAASILYGVLYCLIK